MTAVRIDAGDLEVEADLTGAGEPVVVIGTAVIGDELLPLAHALAAGGGLEVLHYRRRGYGRNEPSCGSIVLDAADAAAVIGAWRAGPVHVVGASYSGAVALTLAATAPGSVLSLSVVEAPPTGTAHAPEFVAVNRGLLARARTVGERVALDELMRVLDGDQWRRACDRAVPGSAAQAERDAPAFFGGDVPAIIEWASRDADAHQVTAPTLCVRGSETSPWFLEMHSLLLGAVPGARGVVVPGGGHSVATTHTAQVCEAVRRHIERHPVAGRSSQVDEA